MTLYADILLLVNGTMNVLILWIVVKLMRNRLSGGKKVRYSRIITGGLSMALLHGIFLFTHTSAIRPLLASLVILTAGILIIFYPIRLKYFFIAILLAYTASFAVGGLGMGLFYLTDFPYAVSVISRDLTGMAAQLPWYLPVICVLLSYISIKLGLRAAERIARRRQSLCPVQIFLGGDAVCFNALVDTGHCLKEPISQFPVIIAEFEQVRLFLPEGLRLLFHEKRENYLHSLAQREPDPFSARLRMIPFTSLGRANGMLIGFRPDGVTVGEQPSVSDVVIGIYNNRLTRDGRYQGLLSPELVS
jgi:stage II sporulation protein GA (sporulation sigma-E factor processing peptidase)